MDLIRLLGPLALASRFKRLSDRLMKDASRIYREQKLDFEPRWFPVFYLLSEQSPLAVTEIARELHITHPAVNQVAGAMEKAGLIVSWRDKKDDRKRLLALSPSGKYLIKELMPLWSDIKQAACELLDESSPNLLAALDRIESALDNTGMFDRIKAKIKKRQLEAVEIIDYKPCYRKYFRMLNLEWLKKYFSVEPIDKKVLGDPNGKILTKGGQILFARVNGEIVGTVALIRRNKTTFELVKMAVTEKAQGRHIGKRLAQTAIDRARSLGAHTIVLNTSPKLAVANRLYRQLGFVRVASTLQQERGYQRPTITLKLNIEDNKKPNNQKRRYYA